MPVLSKSLVGGVGGGFGASVRAGFAAAALAVSGFAGAGVGSLAVAPATGLDRSGVRARGATGGLFLSLSVISSSWPIPAKTPRRA